MTPGAEPSRLAPPIPCGFPSDGQRPGGGQARSPGCTRPTALRVWAAGLSMRKPDPVPHPRPRGLPGLWRHLLGADGTFLLWGPELLAIGSPRGSLGRELPGSAPGTNPRAHRPGHTEAATGTQASPQLSLQGRPHRGWGSGATENPGGQASCCSCPSCPQAGALPRRGEPHCEYLGLSSRGLLGSP